MKGEGSSPKQSIFSLAVSLSHEEAQIFIYSPLGSKCFHLLIFCLKEIERRMSVCVTSCHGSAFLTKILFLSDIILKSK